MRRRRARCVGSSDPVRPVKRPQDRMPVGVEVVHDDVQPQPARIARAQPPKGRQDVPRRLPAPRRAHQAIAVDAIEPQELLGPLGPVIGGPLAPRMSDPGQPNAGDWSQFQRPPLVEANHRSAPWPPLVEAEHARFSASNARSGDCFLVLSRCGVTPKRRSTRRTHSSVIAGHSPCCLEYAVSLAVGHSVKGKPKSAGRLRAHFDQCPDLLAGQNRFPSVGVGRPLERLEPRGVEPMKPSVHGVHVASYAIGNRKTGVPPCGFGNDPVPLVQANGQGRDTELGFQQPSFLKRHARRVREGMGASAAAMNAATYATLLLRVIEPEFLILVLSSSYDLKPSTTL